MSDLTSLSASSVQQILPQARAAWLYGSAARGELRPSSDLDIAVLLPPSQPLTPTEMHTKAMELASVLGRPVDLVNIQTVSPVLQAEVFSDGQCLFATDAVEVADAELAALAQYRAYNERFAAEFESIAARGKVLS